MNKNELIEKIAHKHFNLINSGGYTCVYYSKVEDCVKESFKAGQENLLEKDSAKCMECEKQIKESGFIEEELIRQKAKFDERERIVKIIDERLYIILKEELRANCKICSTQYGQCFICQEKIKRYDELAKLKSEASRK